MMEVLQAGLLTTIQDIGRPGFQAQGVSRGGAMDTEAIRLANNLVGNDLGRAALELTVSGGRFKFHQDVSIAITGADLQPDVAGLAIPMYRRVRLPAGVELRFRGCTWGCRAYVAVAGGFEVPSVLGSRSTDLRCAFGGFHGRTLQSGDCIPIGGGGSGESALPQACVKEPTWDPWSVRWLQLWPRSGDKHKTIRVMPGTEYDDFEQQSIGVFTSKIYHITPQSNRMGYRLDGTTLVRRGAVELLSEAVTIGTVQVPPSGHPIVIMADGQVTGGYPKIAQVATVDLPPLAQMKPGDDIQFHWISLAEAQRLLLIRRQQLACLDYVIRARLREPRCEARV